MEGIAKTGASAGLARAPGAYVRARALPLPGAAYALAGALGVAVLLRFATLHLQSFDFDELQTVRLLRGGFGDLLAGIARDESTPPLYYIVAWGWCKLFGTGEVGLRSLSAVLGTVTIPVVYAIARELASRRAAIIAAALTATSPWLVWYSQEARAYALVLLLAALSLWLFLGAVREPSALRLASWAIASALALAAHYFAVFLVVPEAAWLLFAVRPQRRLLPALAGVALVAGGLLPLALHQRAQGHGDQMIRVSGSLPLRVAQLPKQSLVGYAAPAKFWVAALAGLLALAGLVRLARGGARERRAAAALAAITGAAVAVPLALALVGLDYVDARNLIATCVPLAILIAIGFSTRRAPGWGAAGALALSVLFCAITVSVAATPAYQREDWRGAARSLGAPVVARAIVLTPPSSPEPFAVYLPSLRPLPAGGAAVREVDLVAIANTLGRAGHGRALPSPAGLRSPAPGFHQIQVTTAATYVTVRFRSPRPVRVTPRSLARVGLQAKVGAGVFIQ
ncbi:MAG: DUF2723 domain-containing protein [Actinobacteria bacterium]|nr:MAG: DUF2723 domain-containing protein [Actinomycetota bacterium]